MNHAMNLFCAYIYHPGGLESYDSLTKDNSACATLRKLGAVCGPVLKNAKASIKLTHTFNQRTSLASIAQQVQ